MSSATSARITRRPDDRLVAGVCSGVARAFDVDVWVVRAAAVALALAGGAGLIAYAAAWALMPAGPPGGQHPPRATGGARDRRGPETGEALAIGAIVLGVVLAVRATGLWFDDAVVWPVALAGAGLAVIWRQASDEQRHSLAGIVGSLDVRSRRAALARVVLGTALVVGGVSAFLAANNAFSAVREAVLASAGIVGGLALISGPWWLRLGRDLARERRQRIRSEERAELAAHLHDSVLQTLALIQRTADDPKAVVAMARKQERELRNWLYGHKPAATDGPARLGPALAAVAEEVEGLHGARIEVVTVGDCALDDRLVALVAAAREAMVNAAKWAGVGEVSVYSEVRDGEVSVFVRDWGRGFDLATVGEGHHGLRESVQARMARQGGTADVRTAPGEGTEIVLRVPRVPR